MNILLLTPQLPYPPHQGTSLRNFHIIRGLAERHPVSLLSFLESNQSMDAEKIRPLSTLCQIIEIVPVPQRSTGKRLQQLVTTRRPDMAHRLFSPEFNGKLQKLLTENQFDIVQIEGIELARAIEIVRVASPRSKIVFDDHNAETELQRRNFLTDLGILHRWPAAVYSWIQVGRLRRFERWACMESDAVTAVSDADREHLLALSGQASGISPLSITVIPNSIDVTQYETAPDEVISFDLMFSGKMDYRPNVDAVLWFAEEVWPGIKAKRPSTTWAIVGQKPHARLEPLRDLDGVTITGWVDSMAPYLHGAKISIMPFRIGSGTRLKIIEAMAAKKPIVSTPIGAEGFPLRHDKELLLAETATGLETAVLHLLDSPTDQKRLGEAAHQFAQQYDWRNVVPQFEEVY